MPYINKKPIAPKRIAYVKKSDDNVNYYGSSAWQRLRNMYLSLNPVCEECLNHNRVVPAVEVHHIIPFMSGMTEEARWNLFLNDSNLKSLCTKCHHAYHRKLRHEKLKSVNGLTNDEWEQGQQMYDDD